VHRLTVISLRHPKSALALIGVLTLILSIGILRLRTEYGYRVLIGDDHPSVRALDDFITRFGGGLPMSVAWPCGPGHPCHHALDAASLQMANLLTDRMTRSEWVRRVYGVANAPLLVPRNDGFSIRRLVENGEPRADTESLLHYAISDPLWNGTLISDDGSVGVVVVQPIDTRSETEFRLVSELMDALAPFEAAGFIFYLVGEGVAGVLGGQDLAESTARMVPLTALVISLSLYVLFRSWKIVVLAVGTVLVGLLWTFGALGWLGWPQDGLLEVLAPLVLVVGVCDSVHLLAACSIQEVAPADREPDAIACTAILTATRNVGAPCLVTTLTTGAGFLSFITSRLDSFVRFGFMSTIGILACLVLTFSLLPLLMRFVPSLIAEVRVPCGPWQTGLGGLAQFVELRAKEILGISVALLVGCGLGWLLYLSVDTDWCETFGEQSRAVRSIRFMESNIGQSETLEIQLTLPSTVGFEEPRVMSEVRKLNKFLAGVSGLGRSRSAIDVLDNVSRSLSAGDPQSKGLAGNGEYNAQLLELVSFDDPDALAPWLTIDRQHLRLSVEAHELPFSKRERVLETVSAYLGTELPSRWSATVTGPLSIGYDWIRDVQRTQVRSFPTAFVLVFLLVAVFLRSIWLAAVAMVPTLLPVAVTLGLMGWVGMNLDVGRSMIAAITLGIAVDDAIHVLSHYQTRRRLGDAPGVAIRHAAIHTGRAVVTTSLALAVGFLTLLLSAWQTISSFGFFVAITILAALAAALLVLPAMIFVLAGEK